MQIKVTVNLGNYQSVGVGSSDFPDVEDCIDEVRDALVRIREPATDAFSKRYLKAREV